MSLGIRAATLDRGFTPIRVQEWTTMGHQSAIDSIHRLPPLVGLRVVVVSNGLERAYDRARFLDGMGYRVAACGDPSGAIGFVGELSPEAIVLDLGRELPAADEVVSSLRGVTSCPIVVVGGAGSLSEMTRCYDAGADDYTRPQAPTEEVDLRLRSLFRRLQSRGGAAQVAPAETVYQVGDLEIDPSSQVVRKRGTTVALSPTEFRLLLTLAERRGSVIPAKALIARVWGNQYSEETHYLRLYVRYLRQKLEDDPSNPRYIVNRWGAGYALEEPARAA